MPKDVFLYLRAGLLSFTTFRAVKLNLFCCWMCFAVCCRLEELNEKKDSMVQRVKVAEKDKTGLEVLSPSIKLLFYRDLSDHQRYF